MAGRARGVEDFTVRIAAYRPADFGAVLAFVAAIQEHERAGIPELRPGGEVGARYAELLVRTVEEKNGVILLARDGEQAVGFACAWVDEDDDVLLRADARRHAYVSDIFVDQHWRHKGLGRRLLAAIEAAMSERGCRRMRIRSKAFNVAALKCYEAAGFEPYEIMLAKTITS